MPIKATVSAESWARLNDFLNDDAVQARLEQLVQHGIKAARRRVLADLHFHRSEVNRARFMWQPQPDTAQRRRVGYLIAKGFIRLTIR
jgi:DNA-directed RNA polymerase sigma subunit (sigma70/sigma32)